MKIYTIASYVESGVPPQMGTTQIPQGHIRLYHYTRGNPDDVRSYGLKLSHAKGHTYGEPDLVWASSNPPDPRSKNIVEFHVPANDPSMALEKPRDGQSLDEWQSGMNHVGFVRDIQPNEIIAVHEPWHVKYRYIMSHPDVLKRVLSGELDDLMNSQYHLDDGRAIKEIKLRSGVKSTPDKKNEKSFDKIEEGR